HTRNVKFIDFDFVIGADGTKFFQSILINPKYLYYWTIFAADEIKNRGYGRHYSLLKKEPIPLPPFEEQERIVSKVRGMLKKVDQFSALEKKMEVLNSSFPVNMEKSILQYAIQGKLLPQKNNEGSAEDLLKKITRKKKQLIEQKIIKKEK